MGSSCPWARSSAWGPVPAGRQAGHHGRLHGAGPDRLAVSAGRRRGGAGDGAAGRAAVCVRRAALRRAAGHGLGHEHAGLRHPAAKRGFRRVGAGARDGAGAVRRRGDPRVRRGRAHAGAAAAGRGRHSDAGVRPHHERQHAGPRDARGRRQSGGGQPDGHQRQRGDDRRLLRQLGAGGPGRLPGGADHLGLDLHGAGDRPEGLFRRHDRRPDQSRGCVLGGFVLGLLEPM